MGTDQILPILSSTHNQDEFVFFDRFIMSVSKINHKCNCSYLATLPKCTGMDRSGLKKNPQYGLITIPVIHPSVFALFSDPQRTLTLRGLVF